MRKQFVKTVESLMRNNKETVLLLGDIGVFGFQKCFAEFTERVYNIGILEQATVSLASGLAKSGLVPIVHTIAPFLIERSYEQLKLDFGYQRHGGNFVSVGASYDYAALGCTHHCPADVSVLLNIPGMEIVVPGTAREFDQLFHQAYANGRPTYFRLSERENLKSYDVEFGKANLIKKGKLATVVAVGPTLQNVILAVENLDVTVLYYTSLQPFDHEMLQKNFENSNKVFVVEPFYAGTLASEVLQTVGSRPIALDFVGIPKKFLNNYGSAEDHDKHIGLTAENIKSRLERFING
jgi:transketolase